MEKSSSPNSGNLNNSSNLNSRNTNNSSNLNLDNLNNSNNLNSSNFENRVSENKISQISENMANSNIIIPTIKNLVENAFKIKASDLHIRVGQKPRFRIKGELIIIKEYIKITKELFNNFLEEILTLSQRKVLAQTKEIDSAIFYPGLVRCRVNCFDSVNGGAMALRLMSLKVPSIDELELPQILKEIVSNPQGLILVTGPTGTGKTTTVAAMMRHLNENFNKHIITIEDPIAFVHPSHKCLITQREVGLHTHNFNQALRAALREDPDIIMIEELRDRNTVETVLQAAQTGHLVLSTLHTRNALDVINRLVNLYNPDAQYPIRIQLVESLIAVISQTLIKTVDNNLIPINDILINTPTMQDYLLKNNKDEALKLMEDDLNGMQIMNEVIYELLLEGRININEAFKNSPDPAELERRIRTGGIEGHSSAREWMKYNE